MWDCKICRFLCTDQGLANDLQAKSGQRPGFLQPRASSGFYILKYLYKYLHNIVIFTSWSTEPLMKTFCWLLVHMAENTPGSCSVSRLGKRTSGCGQTDGVCGNPSPVEGRDGPWRSPWLPAPRGRGRWVTVCRRHWTGLVFQLRKLEPLPLLHQTQIRKQ